MRKLAFSISMLAFMVAASARAETLDQALVDAYKQNPTLLAKQAELRATDESLAQAMSGYRPILSVDADAGRRKTDGDTSGVSRSETLNPRTAAVTVTQPVFRGGRTVAATGLANANIKAGQAELWDTEQATLLDAVTAYMDVMRDRAVVDLNLNNQRVLQRQLEATRDRFSVGELTRTDVAQSESRMERAKAGVITAQGQLATSQARFARIIGRAPSDVMEPPPALSDLPATREDAITAAKAVNPQYIAAQFRMQSAKQQVDLTRGEELPEINLQGQAASRWDSSRDGDQVDDVSVLAQLSFPFYQGGAVMARTRAAKQTASQRQLEVAAAERNVSEQAGRSFDDLQTARANIEAFNASLRAAEVALDGVRQEQEVGSRTILDVLDAEQELLDTKVSLVRAQRDQVVAAYTVLSAIGKLTAADLKLPVDLYNPDIHLRDTKYRWIGY
jgi:outer membrane protein